jgi:hypothetical protein
MNELEPRKNSGAILSSTMQPGEIVAVIDHVHQVIKGAMSEGIDNDYAVIPGTRKKTLLKSGSEKLLMAFGLVAVARKPIIVDMEGGHREVFIETEVRHLSTGNVHAVGLGSCSTMESRYRYRAGTPESTGSPVPKEYWDIRKSNPAEAQKILGGSGFITKKTESGSWEIFKKGEIIENPDPADQYNTCLKMASKRSMIDGVLRATAASAMFTQDMEDFAPINTGGKDNAKREDKVRTKDNVDSVRVESCNYLDARISETGYGPTCDETRLFKNKIYKSSLDTEDIPSFIDYVLGDEPTIDSAKAIESDFENALKYFMEAK